jgi:thiol-disulfide isomerase/thioredoxin
MKKNLILLAIALVAIISCGGKKNNSAKAAAAEQNAAPAEQTAAPAEQTKVSMVTSTQEGAMFTDFEAVQPDGSVAKLSDYVGKGKYILVDFWASWCGPCKREIPNIKAAWNKYKGDKFDVLSVAVWDKPEDTAKAAEEHGVVWNQIVNAQKTPTDIYGIEGIPHLILFGPDGTIVKRGDALRGEGLDAFLSSIL